MHRNLQSRLHKGKFCSEMGTKLIEYILPEFVSLTETATKKAINWKGGL